MAFQFSCIACGTSMEEIENAPLTYQCSNINCDKYKKVFTFEECAEIEESGYYENFEEEEEDEEEEEEEND